MTVACHTYERLSLFTGRGLSLHLSTTVTFLNVKNRVNSWSGFRNTILRNFCCSHNVFIKHVMQYKLKTLL